MPDFKLALRTLVRTPFVTGVAIASLALGIGANTAIFSLIQRVLLRSLPVANPGELVNVINEGPNPGSQTCNRAGNCDVIFTYPMFRDLEKAQTVLTGLAGHRTIGADIAYQGKTTSGEGMLVSGSYFSILGLTPALGRLIGAEDNRNPGGELVAVLSHRYWSNELGGDPAILNQTIVVNGAALTVVGVAPPEFEGTTLGTKADIFAPLTVFGIMTPWFEGFENRQSYWLYLFGRLKPGVDRNAAAAQLNSIYRPIINDVEVALQVGLSDQMLQRFKTKKVTLEAGAQGQSSLKAQTTTPLLLLLVVTAIVLLVACTNVANLLLARAANRSAEMAIRSSLGAQRGQLAAQLMTESAILAIVSGGLSLLVAKGTLGLITSFLPRELTSSLDFGLDAPVMLFAAGLSVGTTFIFGLLPALQATRPDLLSVIKANPGRGSGNRSAVRFRGALVTGQIALSMALLCSAGLFLRSLVNVGKVQLGVRVDSVVTFALSPGQMGYKAAETRSVFQKVQESLAAIPGVTQVTLALVPILVGWSNGSDVDVEGTEVTADTDVNVRTNYVGPAYFRTLGIPVVAGREFSESDDLAAPRVVLVNEEFLTKFKVTGDPIGRRVTFGGRMSRRPGSTPEWKTIVGVVKNSAYDDVKRKPTAMMFTAFRQDTMLGRATFYARSAIAPASIIKAVTPMLAAVAPNLPVTELTTLPRQVEDNLYLDRMITTLSAAFALLATLLAAVGLYGVLAYNVAQRTREIGVRIALGADAMRVQGLVVRQVGMMTLVGGIVGLTAAAGIGTAAQSLLFGIKGLDPFAFGGAAVTITSVALLAAYLPARRAAKIHPINALRSD